MTLFLFLFYLQQSKSVNFELGEKYGGSHYKPQDQNGVILIQQTIFQTFHNAKGDLGGCIYAHNDQITVGFNTVGFADCYTTNQGGALNILAKTIQIQNVCAYLCEATNKSYQFAKLESNFNHDNNRISFLTIVSCGSKNKGDSAIGFCGATKFYTNNFNSSNNMNNYNTNPYGACFRTHGIITHQTSFVNFLNSEGCDVFHTEFTENSATTGSFMNGNVYNCTTKYIFKFKGHNTIDNFHFGRLTFSKGAFICMSGDKTAHSLTVVNSLIDSAPSGIDSNVKTNGCNLANPLVLINIDNIGLDYCPVPSPKFTKSDEFTKTMEFSPSQKFTKTIEFSPSQKFTKTMEFSPSQKFTKTIDFTFSKKFTRTRDFSPSSGFTKKIDFSSSQKFTITISFSPSEHSVSSYFAFSTTFSPFMSHAASTNFFTPSNHFTPSFTFRPNATKYPDGLGYKNAQISGQKSGKKATATQIYATSGISFAFIIVAVALMLLYLRSKRKQLLEEQEELSDSFLVESTYSTSTYSYSYYTYDFYYSYGTRYSYYSDYSDSTYEKSYDEFNSADCSYS